MVHLLEDIIYFWLPGLFFPVVTIGFGFFLEHFIEKTLIKHGYKVGPYQRIFYVVVIFLVVLIASFFIIGAISSGGLISFLGDDPISFIKHMFGY